MKMAGRLAVEIFIIFQHFLSLIPGVLGVRIRRLFYKFYLGKCGKGFSSGTCVKIQTPSAVFIGDNVGLNDRVWIAANKHHGGEIIIGNDVIIGPNTIIHSGNHKFDMPAIPIRLQGYEFSSIVIEENVWIAAGVIILSGVKIGKGAIVAAGSVVTRDVEPFSIIGGVPAKLISKRSHEH